MTTPNTTGKNPAESNTITPEAVLRNVRGWVIDVDGCLMRTKRAGGSGGEPMPKAVDFLEGLYAAGHPVVVCTNASQRTPHDYAEHLRSTGLPVRDEDFVTAGSAAADHIAHHHPQARVLVVGDKGISAPLADRGIALADPEDPESVDVVVVGAASTYTSAQLNAGSLAVDAGAPFYTTVNSPWFHGGIGKSAAASATIAAAIGWTGGGTAEVVGKPSAALGEALVRRLGIDRSAIAVVGDAPAEMTLAHRIGGRGVLLLSGATSAEGANELTDEETPDVVLDEIADLHGLLGTLPAIAP